MFSDTLAYGNSYSLLALKARINTPELNAITGSNYLKVTTSKLGMVNCMIVDWYDKSFKYSLRITFLKDITISSQLALLNYMFVKYLDIFK